MVELGDSVRLVSLQFSFSNPKAIPHAIVKYAKRRDAETLKARGERKARSGGGAMVIPPFERCALPTFLDDLADAGYEMVDVLYQPRANPGDPCGHAKYHMVRFLFCRAEHVDISEQFRELRDTFSFALRGMCHAAFWRVRAFLNSYYKDGEEVAGQHALSINFEARIPLCQADGSLVLARLKDANGIAYGNPVPLVQAAYLRVNNNRVVFS